MFKHAYSLIREFLDDEELQHFFVENTGKHLAVINAGAQVTSPTAKISLNSGEVSRKSNTNNDLVFSVSFAIPFFGSDAFERCIDFVDFVAPICLDYKTKHTFIKYVTPSIIELDNENDFWVVVLNISISTLF